jgi:deazaflavin-dependent oxidoreductase (nitroreductase family)
VPCIVNGTNYSPWKGIAMTFTHPTGTRGARQPGRLYRWMNRLILGRARRTRSTIMGMNLLVLTTIGRKSRQARQTPLAWFPGPDGSWLVVASAGGAAANPAWYLNLAAHPDQVTVEQGGRKVAVTAQELHGAERAEAWERIMAEAANFRRYEVATDREMPVIRLTPKD